MPLFQRGGEDYDEKASQYDVIKDGSIYIPSDENIFLDNPDIPMNKYKYRSVNQDPKAIYILSGNESEKLRQKLSIDFDTGIFHHMKNNRISPNQMLEQIDDSSVDLSTLTKAIFSELRFIQEWPISAGIGESSEKLFIITTAVIFGLLGLFSVSVGGTTSQLSPNGIMKKGTPQYVLLLIGLLLIIYSIIMSIVRGMYDRIVPKQYKKMRTV